MAELEASVEIARLRALLVQMEEELAHSERECLVLREENRRLAAELATCRAAVPPWESR